MLIPVNTMLLKSDMFWSVEFNPFHFHCFLSLCLLSLPSSGIHVFPTPHPPKTGGSDCLVESQIQTDLSVCSSLHLLSPVSSFFLQLFYYYSFSFPASQAIHLCTFAIIDCALKVSQAMWFNVYHTCILLSAPHGKSGLSLVRVLEL